MTTAYTSCRESRDRTWLSSLSSAIAPNKSSLMAVRTSLTSYTKVQCRTQLYLTTYCQSINCQRVSFSPNTISLWALTFQSSQRHRRSESNLTRPSKHRSRHKMRRLERRETRLLMRYAQSSPVSRRISSERPFTVHLNSSRLAAETPHTPVNYPTDQMRNIGLYQRRTV